MKVARYIRLTPRLQEFMPNFELFKFKNAEGVASSKKKPTLKSLFPFMDPFFIFTLKTACPFVMNFSV